MTNESAVDEPEATESRRGWRIIGGVAGVGVVVFLLLWSPWSSPPSTYDKANDTWDKWVESKQEEACADFHASSDMEEYISIWGVELTGGGLNAPEVRRIFAERC